MLFQRHRGAGSLCGVPTDHGCTRLVLLHHDLLCELPRPGGDNAVNSQSVDGRTAHYFQEIMALIPMNPTATSLRDCVGINGPLW